MSEPERILFDSRIFSEEHLRIYESVMITEQWQPGLLIGALVIQVLAVGIMYRYRYDFRGARSVSDPEDTLIDHEEGTLADHEQDPFPAARHDPDSEKSIERQNAELDPVGRFGAPADIAGLAAYMAADESGLMTGVCIPMDGGRTAVLRDHDFAQWLRERYDPAVVGCGRAENT